jgi:hypothetical protein
MPLYHLDYPINIQGRFGNQRVVLDWNSIEEGYEKMKDKYHEINDEMRHGAYGYAISHLPVLSKITDETGRHVLYSREFTNPFAPYAHRFPVDVSATVGTRGDKIAFEFGVQGKKFDPETGEFMRHMTDKPPLYERKPKSTMNPHAREYTPYE